MLGISMRTLDRYVQKGILKGKKEGRKLVFSRNIVESMVGQGDPLQGEVVTPKAAPAEKAMTSQQDIQALTKFLEKMQGMMQEKEKYIADLHYELGMYKERVEQQIPLLESRTQTEADLKKTKRQLRRTRFSRTLFAALFVISAGVIAFLVYTFGVF